MALRKSVTLKAYGKDVVLEDVYIKVAEVSGDKTDMTAKVELLGGVEGSKLHDTSYVFQHKLTGVNVIAQAYEYLKTLPEFADATDC